MNTDKNVYILGAGVSREAGLPLQDDFLLVAKEVYFQDTGRYAHFQQVFEYQDRLSKMLNYLNYPLLNLEQLFSLIEMDMFYSGKTELKKIRDSFVKMIGDVLTARMPQVFVHVQHPNHGEPAANRGPYQNYLKFLKFFIVKQDRVSLETHNDTIISLNYDLVLEAAASIFNWEKMENRRAERPRFRETALQFNVKNGKTNIEFEEVETFCLMNGLASFQPHVRVYSEEQSAIKLLKLHGSINCTRTDDGSRFIVPPTWNKSDPTITRLWELAFKELSEAKRLIVIGYSFPETDVYIKSLIALALNENRLLQHICFINPDTGMGKTASLGILAKHFEKHCMYKEWKFSYLVGTKEGADFVEEHLNRFPNKELVMR